MRDPDTDRPADTHTHSLTTANGVAYTVTVTFPGTDIVADTVPCPYCLTGSKPDPEPQPDGELLAGQ